MLHAVRGALIRILEDGLEEGLLCLHQAGGSGSYMEVAGAKRQRGGCAVFHGKS